MKWVIVCLLAAGLAMAQPALAEKKPWTVMVYLDGDNNLEGCGLSDINEMEKVGSNDVMNIVALVDRIKMSGSMFDDTTNGDWTDTKTYLIKKDDDNAKIASEQLQYPGKETTEVNMGDPRSLVDFVRFCAKNYPAERYALVIWNHGSGVDDENIYKGNSKAIAYDDTDKDYITMPELRSALSSIKSTLGKKLDLLEMDACLMGMLEVAYHVRESVDVVSFSEESEPGDGDAYDTALARIKKGTDAEGFATAIGEEYNKYYKANPNRYQAIPLRGTTKSAVRTSKVEALAKSVDALAQALKDSMKDNREKIKACREKVLYFEDTHMSHLPSDPKNYTYVDLGHLVKLVGAEIQDNRIAKSVTDVQKAMKDALVYSGYVDANFKEATGLTVYFPRQKDHYEADYYDGLPFAKATNWDELLASFYSGTDTDNDTDDSDNDTDNDTDEDSETDDELDEWIEWLEGVFQASDKVVRADNEISSMAALEEAEQLKESALARLNRAVNSNDHETIVAFLVMQARNKARINGLAASVLSEIKAELAPMMRSCGSFNRTVMLLKLKSAKWNK